MRNIAVLSWLLLWEILHSQGLAFHIKSMHNIINEAPQIKKNQVDYDELLSLEVKEVVDKMVNSVVVAEAKSLGASTNSGKKESVYSHVQGSCNI